MTDSRSGSLQVAATYLENFIKMIQSDPSQRLAEAHACNQLGSLYRKMNQIPQSVQYFERFYKLAVQLKKEEHAASVKQSETNPQKEKENQRKHSSLSNLIKTEDLALPDVGLASVQLGIIRGNARMTQFFETVKDPKKMESLLRWKGFRQFEPLNSEPSVQGVSQAV